MEIFKAFSQWATRPVDQRFWTVEAMVEACRAYRRQAATASVKYRDLRVEADGSDMRLVGATGADASLTHYAFGQLAQRAHAPSAYLRKLPATLAAQNLNHGLKQRDPADKAELLFHRNGGLLLRAALSEKYERIWNHEVGERIMEMEADGWRVPPARPSRPDVPGARPATEADVLADRGHGLSVNVGDVIAPAGVYASDRDMFVFLVNEERTVDDGTYGGMARFLMLWNSEVGDKSLGGIGGYYKHVCGNHIVWDAQGVVDFKVRHVGRRARAKTWRQLRVDVRKYADSSTSDARAQIEVARRFELGADKDEAVSKLLGFARKRKLTGVTEDVLTSAFDAAEEHRSWYGAAPTTVWGMVNGLTEVSQRTEHASSRAKLDKAAGKIMRMAF